MASCAKSASACGLRNAISGVSTLFCPWLAAGREARAAVPVFPGIPLCSPAVVGARGPRGAVGSADVPAELGSPLLSAPRPLGDSLPGVSFPPGGPPREVIVVEVPAPAASVPSPIGVTPLGISTTFATLAPFGTPPVPRGAVRDPVCPLEPDPLFPSPDCPGTLAASPARRSSRATPPSAVPAPLRPMAR